MAAQWVSVVMAPSAGTVEAESPPLVRSNGSVNGTDMHEPRVEEPFYSQRDLVELSEGWRQGSHW
jgi:hypothetical protein